MAPEADDPHWPRETAAAVYHEIIAYLTTARAIILHPARFGAEWSTGARRALNPVAFQLNALAVVGPWLVFWARLVDPNPPATPLWWDIIKSTLPTVGSAVGMSLCHVLVRLMGGARPLRSTLAMVFYISGGPLALLSLASRPLSLLAVVHPNDLRLGLASAAINLAMFVVLVWYQVVTLSALHQISRLRATIATLITWIAYGGLWAWLSFVRPELIHSLLDS